MKYQVLSDVLKDRARKLPNAVAYAEIKNDLSLRKSITNIELLNQATQIAQRIKLEKTNDELPVYIFSSSRIEFIELFWGAQMAGQAAIPLNLPNFIFYKKQQKRILNIFKKVKAEIGLYHVADQDLFNEFLEKNPEISSIKWICVSEGFANRTDFELTQPNSKKTAVIQFTSGSTGDPKGVPLSHEQILFNLHDMVHHLSPDCFETMVFWLPHNHDMGLFGGFLTAFYYGGQTLLIKTQDYLKNPMVWLSSLSKFKGTSTAAPNFAFEGLSKIANKAPASLNLSSLKLIFNGAEFINYKTILNFIDLYGPYGLNESAFCNCYGLAESTLMISGGVFNRQKSICNISKSALRTGGLKFVESDSNDALGVVCCGAAVKNNEFRLSEYPLGHIIISGASVAQRYYSDEDPDRFQTIFENGISKTFFDTNDIGFIQNDQLYVLGRTDDVIIHNGEKFFNVDFAESISTVSESIAPNSILVYKVAEVVKIALEMSESVDSELIKKSIQEKIFFEYLIKSEVTIVKRGYLPRTTSGKVIRKDAIEKLENG